MDLNGSKCGRKWAYLNFEALNHYGTNRMIIMEVFGLKKYWRLKLVEVLN